MLTDEFFLGTKLYHQKFAELCRPLAEYLGVTHAIYVNIDKHGKIFSVCTHEKWIERFIEEKYYKFDIIDSKTYSLLVLGFCTVTLS